MPTTQSDKSQTFAALHERPDAFVIANVFDSGTARMMAELGFEALATSSWVQANMIGKDDGESTRAEALAHAKIIVDATDLPVSADLVNGFGDEPGEVAKTIVEAGETGLAGASIEDASGNREEPIYDLEFATQRIEAAVDAARSLPFNFVLTARSENFVNDVKDLDDTIRRLTAFEAAGADVLMAPGLPDLDSVRAVCDSLNKPFSFMAGIPGRSYTVAELSAAGVKRISLATSLYDVAMAATREAASEIIEKGTFDFIGGQS